MGKLVQCINVFAVIVLSISAKTDLLPLKDVPQVLKAQALHELTYIHVQHGHYGKMVKVE